MPATVGRTAVLGYIRVGQYRCAYNSAHSLRQYASAPGDDSKPKPQPDQTSLKADDSNDNSREPVESVLQRILEPKHAKSIGVSPETTDTKVPKASRGDQQRALVPLNIIYLPPPKWHQPLKPFVERQQQKQTKLNVDAGSPWEAASTEHGFSALKGRAELEEDRGKELASAARSEGIIARLARVFASRSQPDKPDKPPKETPKGTPKGTPKDTPKIAPELDPELDSSSSQHADQKTQIDLSRVTAEKWQGSAAYRILGTWRRTLDSLRSLPKDDDWVTWAGKALNEITGYDRVALLKMQVDLNGTEFHAARRRLDDTKAQHARATKGRIANQREINSLLQRKHLWTEDDVARFTSLYRDEHQSEGAEMKAARELKDAETLVDRRYDELVNAIRERYHEEQIWSDKIRRASTYGTWAVLFMNIVALFLAQAIFEPRKRRKIIAGVDERLSEAMGEQRAQIESSDRALELRLAEQEKVAAQMARHLYNMSAAIDAISVRQESELSVLGARLSEPEQRAEAVVDPSLLLGGSDGYSDTELDMYYAQMQAAPRRTLIPGSMIWKVASGAQPQQRQMQAYSRAEAGQLAFETAAVTGLVAGLIAYWLSA
ncbi:sensitivity to high expression protein she9 [Coemansia erecta]|nr:sensitivity to high expression protein she9 [Coemansia sp. RSA 2618]KAJ2830803.1 sensitivity to high expression protein she9 [Coemansia erecta]